MTRRQALALARAMVRELGKDDWHPEVTLVTRVPPRTFEIRAVSNCRRFSVTSLHNKLYSAHALGYVETDWTAVYAVRGVRDQLLRKFRELRSVLRDSPSVVGGEGLVTRRFLK